MRCAPWQCDPLMSPLTSEVVPSRAGAERHSQDFRCRAAQRSAVSRGSPSISHCRFRSPQRASCIRPSVADASQRAAKSSRCHRRSTLFLPFARRRSVTETLLDALERGEKGCSKRACCGHRTAEIPDAPTPQEISYWAKSGVDRRWIGDTSQIPASFPICCLLPDSRSNPV